MTKSNDELKAFSPKGKDPEAEKDAYDIGYEHGRSSISDLAPTSQWRDISEWHEDYGDCLFIFLHDGIYEGCEWTSPLTITADGETFDELWGYCDQIAFKRVDTSGEIPTPPTKDLADAGKEGV